MRTSLKDSPATNANNCSLFYFCSLVAISGRLSSLVAELIQRKFQMNMQKYF